MQITIDDINRTCPENDIYNALDLDDKHILELGCGKAVIARAIATEGKNRQVTALEVDEIQYAQNMQIRDLPNVRFKLAGAQSIPEPDDSVDIVMMFKSLHHVPVELMGQGLTEIHRVLKPGGYLYISEPVFAGDFNEILRLFHNEQVVREAAFNATKKAVDTGLFNLVEQIFFNTPVYFENFAAFEENVINVTHSDHQLSPELYHEVKARFVEKESDNGAHFNMPVRVDLLRRP